jgi:membrane protein YdbS with pleckstrin-like domain
MINNLSKSIQERKQARTNMLLQAVTILTSITSLGPIFIFLQQVQFYFKWSDMFFKCSLSVILLSMIIAIFIYLKLDKFKKIVRKTYKN